MTLKTKTVIFVYALVNILLLACELFDISFVLVILSSIPMYLYIKKHLVEYMSAENLDEKSPLPLLITILGTAVEILFLFIFATLIYLY